MYTWAVTVVYTDGNTTDTTYYGCSLRDILRILDVLNQEHHYYFIDRIDVRRVKEQRDAE